MITAGTDRESGFALLESVVVLALAALALVTLLLAADLVTRNAAAASRRANELEALATGLTALGRDIEAVKPIAVGSLAGPLLFRGEPVSLAFVRAGSGGDELIWIAVDDERDRGSLVRSAAPLLPQTADFASARFDNATAILAGPWTYQFSYAAAGDPPFWGGTWSIADQMPVAIRLEVLDRKNGTPVVPPLVVRVRANSPPGCRDEPGGLCPDQPATPQGGEDLVAEPTEP